MTSNRDHTSSGVTGGSDEFPVGTIAGVGESSPVATRRQPRSPLCYSIPSTSGSGSFGPGSESPPSVLSTPTHGAVPATQGSGSCATGSGGHWQKFNFKSKKIASMLSTLKRFATSPKRRLSDRSSLQCSGRLCQSHPNVSRSNLAALAAGAYDDEHLDGAQMYDNLTTTNSQSDTTIHHWRWRRDKSDRSEKDRGLSGARDVPIKTEQLLAIDKKLPQLRLHHRLSVESSGSTLATLAYVEEEPSSSRQDPGASVSTSPISKSFFVLDVCLRCGKNLIAKDPCGTSDPYVKFRIGNRQIYRSRTLSRTLEPFWDESFSVPLDNISQALHVKVYDYDFGLQDDFMGAAEIEIDSLELDKPTDILVNLSETGKQEDASAAQDLGYLMLSLCLTQKPAEDRPQYFSKSAPFRLGLGGSQESQGVVTGPVNRKQKIQIWDSVVNVVLVEGRKLLPMDENGLSDPFVKFRLGNEKYKSKFCLKTLNPQWLEQFDLHMYQEQPKVLEITVWDKDFGGRNDFMGRASIDLRSLEPETTHPIWQELENGAGQIFLLITISGTQVSSAVSDLDSYEPMENGQKLIANKYTFANSFRNMNEVGSLVVKVFKAMGLTAADIGGKSDPFCVLELVNTRLQTHTEYKTLCPEWNKIFIFKLRDIHSVLELTVYDEDRDKKVEFLGKLAVPLVSIRNGEKRWYQLKDRELKKRAKGQILLEFEVVYNPIKACVQTFTPKEVKFMQIDQKFRRVVFMRNVNRVKSLVMHIVEVGRFVNSCFQWESVPRSIIAFALFLLITWTAELYMFPLALLLIFGKNYLFVQMTGSAGEDELCDYNEDDDDEDRDRPVKTAQAARREEVVKRASSGGTRDHCHDSECTWSGSISRRKGQKVSNLFQITFTLLTGTRIRPLAA
ncbi:multiple C2 and transmembrane domain-containing protein 1-like isoform X3 [Varroa destructor]|uniref:C2 domain-containing protein n=1 Tax=Varroa destructor TaxID=109461 RepID=A0A7M7K9V3_VARDE|nr:multiple C2 and transmembrane domain-containing protein 1-like isoform X3 [Varroa destructor]